LIRKKFEDQNTLQKTVAKYFTFLGKEHYCEGMFKLVKRWDERLNDSNDSCKNNL
jgi:hypothetical protein